MLHKVLTQSSENLSQNLKRLTKRKRFANAAESSADEELSRSCSSSNYDNYFFSSERKLDYSQFFFNENEFEFALEEQKALDEIKEENSEGLRKTTSGGDSLLSPQSLAAKFSIMSVTKQDSVDISEKNN